MLKRGRIDCRMCTTAAKAEARSRTFMHLVDQTAAAAQEHDDVGKKDFKAPVILVCSLIG